MSASPVSSAPDRTPTLRRRNAPMGLKNSGLDLASSPVTNGGGKDPIRSIKSGAETVLQSSMDAAKIKGPIPTDADTTLRRRTTAKKAGASPSPKPLWKTILSVFTKNSIVLLVLVLLAQMVRRLAFNQWDKDDALLVSSDYEIRIAEMEAYLKTTTKTMQFRVDAIDQKIQNEITNLKTELSNRIDDNSAESSTLLQKLSKRVDIMEKSEWISKAEFDEFKNHKSLHNFGDSKLDEIRAFAKEIVEKEIEKHAADGIGRVDYAAASAGGTVVDHSDPISDNPNWFHKKLVSKDAVKMIQPSFGEPGQCFALKGTIGFVEIKLRTDIITEAITLEHVAKSVAFDRSSAPKRCRIHGFLRKKGIMEGRHFLGEFVYDLEKSNAQTFKVMDMGHHGIINSLRLDFFSNHGNPTHTCIYRIRVHGREP